MPAGGAAPRVDVHHHAVPPEWRRALERLGQDRSGGAPIPAWDEDATLALMDRQDNALRLFPALAARLGAA